MFRSQEGEGCAESGQFGLDSYRAKRGGIKFLLRGGGSKTYTPLPPPLPLKKCLLANHWGRGGGAQNYPPPLPKSKMNGGYQCLPQPNYPPPSPKSKMKLWSPSLRLWWIPMSTTAFAGSAKIRALLWWQIVLSYQGGVQNFSLEKVHVISPASLLSQTSCVSFPGISETARRQQK